MIGRGWVIAFLLIGTFTSYEVRADTAYEWEICRGNTDDANQAIAACTSLIEEGGLTTSEQEDAYYYRGVAHFDAGEFDLAIADYTQTIALNPNYKLAYNNRGNAHNYKFEYDLGIADENEAIKLDPNYSFAYMNRGLAHDGKGETDLAIADYTQAITLDPKNAIAYYDRGGAYKDKGEYDLAIADETQAINLNPEYAFAYDMRGNVYDDKGEYDLAIADHTRAITLAPKYAEAFNGRGVAYDEKGSYDLAIADFTQAIELGPKTARFYANKGIVLWEQDDASGAIADLQMALKLQPNLQYAQTKLDIYQKDLAAHAKRAQASAVPGRRVALVIGISAYDRLPELPNADGDAKAVAVALKAQGYQVTLVSSDDLSKATQNAQSLTEVISNFADNVVPTAETAVVWYTGHGQSIIVPSTNPKDASTSDDYLLPADFTPGDDPIAKGVDVEQLTWAVGGASKLGAVFIDACRTQKFLRGSEGFKTIGEHKPTKGGVQLSTDNLVVVYSAQPGKSASDGIEGQHSPFAQAFLEGLFKGAAKHDISSFANVLQSRTKAIASQTSNDQEPSIVNDIASWDQPSLAMGPAQQTLAEISR